MNVQKVKTMFNVKSLLSMSLAFFVSFSMFAQMPGMPGGQQQEVKEDFTEKELKQFIEANKMVTEVQQSNEQKMVSAIESENLELEKFNEILMEQQQGQQGEESSHSPEDLEAFNNAAQKVMGIQNEMQGEIQQMLEKDIGFEKYQQIMMAYQNSPKVQEKVNALIEDM